MGTLVGLIGFVFTLRADVDSVKEALGGPGSLPVLELKIEQSAERLARLEQILEKQSDERTKLVDLIRAGQQKIDDLMDMLVKERGKPMRVCGSGPAPGRRCSGSPPI